MEITLENNFGILKKPTCSYEKNTGYFRIIFKDVGNSKEIYITKATFLRPAFLKITFEVRNANDNKVLETNVIKLESKGSLSNDQLERIKDKICWNSFEDIRRLSSEPRKYDIMFYTTNI